MYSLSPTVFETGPFVQWSCIRTHCNCTSILPLRSRTPKHLIFEIFIMSEKWVLIFYRFDCCTTLYYFFIRRTRPSVIKIWCRLYSADPTLDSSAWLLWAKTWFWTWTTTDSSSPPTTEPLRRWTNSWAKVPKVRTSSVLILLNNWSIRWKNPGGSWCSSKVHKKYDSFYFIPTRLNTQRDRTFLRPGSIQLSCYSYYLPD